MLLAGNILNFNVGENVDLLVPRVRLAWLCVSILMGQGAVGGRAADLLVPRVSGALSPFLFGQQAWLASVHVLGEQWTCWCPG